MAEQRTSRRRSSGASDAGERVRRRRPTSRRADADADEDAEALEPDVGHERDRAAGGSELQRQAEETLRGELTSIIRESALEVLGPVARTATTRAAKYLSQSAPIIAKRLGPRLKDTLGPRIEEAGGAGALARDALARFSRAGGGERGLPFPLHDSVDVAVPLETAYNQFTQFEDFPEFMHGVEEVEQDDDTHLVWHAHVWGLRRSWDVEITDQQPNERIAWRTVSGSETTGVVTFHRLGDRLTRIEVIVSVQPEGMLEKAASGLRISARVLRSDLTRFKAFVELRQEETGAWPGRIDEGEVIEEDRETRRARQTRRRASGKRAVKRSEEDDGEPRREGQSRRRASGKRAARRRDEDENEPEDEEFDDEQSDEEESEASQAEEDRNEEDEPEEEPVARKASVRRRTPARPAKKTRGRR
jgi:uncharacterized membrane protein